MLLKLYKFLSRILQVCCSAMEGVQILVTYISGMFQCSVQCIDPSHVYVRHVPVFWKVYRF